MIKYERVGDVACTKAFFTVFEHVLSAMGYRREVKHSSPENPDLLVYVRDGDRISVVMTAVSSDKIKVEVEGPEENLRDVVRKTVELLMAELEDILKLVS